MHEFQRYIQSELDTRGWRQADLVRTSGLSRQLISGILRDTRSHLGQMPDPETIAGLAKGFGVSVDRVRTAAARSLVGYIDDGVALTPTLSEVSTDALLNEIRRRIEGVVRSESAEPDPTAKEPRTQSAEDQKTAATYSVSKTFIESAGIEEDDPLWNMLWDHGITSATKKGRIVDAISAVRGRLAENGSDDWLTASSRTMIVKLVKGDPDVKPADLNPEDQGPNVEPLRPRRRRGRDFTTNPIIDIGYAADDRGPDDESEAERARREQDEHSEENQDNGQ